MKSKQVKKKTSEEVYREGYSQGRADAFKEINGNMRDWSDVRYLLDGVGQLWKGPLAKDDNLHWAKFEGFSEVDGSLIWVLRMSDPPERFMTAEQLERWLASEIVRRALSSRNDK